jgi:formylglycine-generating enzyme required for sulfatase activity/serine/threonine protein kinase
VVGETLNQRYRIERRLGGGSQAEVFLANDDHMERLVAIKIWKPEGGFTVDEFLREAKLLARFGAPHFVTIHEHAATADERPFFVLEYLQGETLQDLSTPLTAVEIHRCVRDICVGLQKAHNEGIVHRDLKPSNIMVIDRGTRTERYVILDLGIAKITDTSNWRRTLADATMAGAGTLLYMSPEQCNGNPIDQRTDIYAFGCLLFMLLVHEEPFANKTGSHLSVLNAILSDPPRRLSEVRPEGQFSEELEQLVQDCLAKKPEKRPASMTEVEARFEQCLPDDVLLAGLGTGTASDASGIRTRRPTATLTQPNRRPKQRALAAVLITMILAAAGSAGFYLTRVQPETKTVANVQPDLKTSPRDKPEVKVARTQADTKGPPKTAPETKAPPRVPDEKKGLPRTPPETKTPPVTVAVVPTHIEKKPDSVPLVKSPAPPQINDDRYVVVRNRTLKTDDPSGKSKDQNHYGVLVNDGLPSGKPFQIDCVDKPKFGELRLNADGTFAYAFALRPGGELVRSDSFKYRVRASDRDPWSEPALVTIAIRPFSDEEEATIKRIAKDYGEVAIRSEPNPPAVLVDFGEGPVHKRIRDDSLKVLDELVEVVREVHLDSQPITDGGLEHLGRFDELRILSLAGTDVTDTGVSKVPSFKNLAEVDLSDTVLTEPVVAALAADRGQKAPLRVIRDGAIDRLRNAGVTIRTQNDVTLGRNGFVATIPRLDQFPKAVPLLKAAPRLVAVVVANTDVTDDLVTENLVRQLQSLKTLDIRGTIVSPERAALLQKDFPGLQLKWDPPLAQLRLIGSVKENGPSGVSIDLSQKKVDGRAWILLSQVDKVTALNLSGVAIDNLAFERLAQMTALRELTLKETGLDGQQIQELCRRIPSLVILDIQKSAIARDKTVLRALLAELRTRDPAKGALRPEPGPSVLTAPFDEATASEARKEWAEHLKSPEQLVNSIGIKLQLIPPGEFRMGSEETYLELVDRFPSVRESEEENPISKLGLESARPQHQVRITRPYYLSVCEVTNSQFKKFTEATARKVGPKKDDKGWGFGQKKAPASSENSISDGRDFPSRYWGVETNEQAPVVNVSWNEAVAFCEWLSHQEGKTYRLPTEAEWEYACRAGSITRYWNGDDPEHLTQIANVRDVTAREKFGWQNTLSSSDGSAFTNDVGRYPPNHFGLFDMHGNASEWCSDWFSQLFYREPPQPDPAGPATGALRIVRGGSWHSSAIFCRSAHRAAEPPAHRSNHIGFRIVYVGTTAPWPAVATTSVAAPTGVAPKPLVAPFKEEQIGEARKAWADYERTDAQRTNTSGMTLVLIPPGEFMMGSTAEQIAQVSQLDPKFKAEAAKHEQPQHRVRISRPFYMTVHEVTRGQFRKFIHATGYKTVCERPGGKGMGLDQTTGRFKTERKYSWHNPAFDQDDTHPVVNVSFRDATAFCAWMTWQEGRLYRLPTEAEWEYACRAGTTTLFSNGDDPESLATIANIADETAKAKFAGWRAIKGRDGFVFTAPVGSFQANAFGLFDMHGNVREWCGDWSADDYYAASPEDDPHGPPAGTARVFRGGAWTTAASDCRASSRGASNPSFASLGLGFRVAAEVSGK